MSQHTKPEDGAPHAGACCAAHAAGAADSHSIAATAHHGYAHEPTEGQAIDPVCGMTVDIGTAKWKTEHEGHFYFFCNPKCLDRFTADPARYLDFEAKERAAQAEADAMPPGTRYTCPMHPEIIQDGPGICPLCGMALEPMGIPPASAGPSPELVDFRRRFIVGAVLTVPLVVIAMGEHLGLPVRSSLGPSLSQLIQLLLAAPVVLWCGQPFFERGVQSVRNQSPNMWTLISLGVAAASIYSVVATLAPGVFPRAMRGPGGVVDVYFESAAVIVVLVLLGQILELKARERTSGALSALLSLAPKTARLITADGSESDVLLETVRPGSRLRVRPGESVPVDGVVVEGHSAVDEKLLTGESLPVDKAPGDEVTGGTMNKSGSFVMEARRVGAETVLARIVGLVADAQRSRAPIQRLADQVAAWFVPAVVAVAALAFAGWMLFGPKPAIAYAIVAAVSVLIVACPCALGLATPISIMVATGRGAREGVLVRSAETLEGLASVDTLVVDKTGTLTEGRPALASVSPREGFDEASILRIAASLEKGSEHPIGDAIIAAAAARGIALAPTRGFEAVHGLGITGEVEGRSVALGNLAMMRKAGLSNSAGEDVLAAAEKEARELAAEGRTALMLAVDGRLAGILAVADTLKPSAAGALADLRSRGIEVIMATGDNAVVAESIARQLGITRVHAEVLPVEKSRIVSELKAQGRKVAFAGDGVNDSPALAAADVGIAMGTGADVAVESAGITLPKGDLRGIVRARALSEATLSNIRQNLAFAFGYNMLGVPVAAGVLYPVLGVLLSPMIAAAAMSLSSVSVITNALRLATVRLPGDPAT